jgi:light-regulated signal transduction histidine kinase (bacteriophytochrome)
MTEKRSNSASLSQENAIDALRRSGEKYKENTADTLDAESQQHTPKISDPTLKMNSLINGLLTLSRLGRQQLSKGQVDLDTLVQEVIQAQAPENQGRKIRG